MTNDYTLDGLMTRGGMTELQALRFMHNVRDNALRSGRCRVTRLIVDGKVRGISVRPMPGSRLPEWF